MVGMLVFANWGKADSGVFKVIYDIKWIITAIFSILFGLIVYFLV